MASIQLSIFSEIVPTFGLDEDRSLDGSPSVSITFPDGYSDTLILSRHYINERAKVAYPDDCHYIGHLEGEPEACVAMTGCPWNLPFCHSIRPSQCSDG